MRQNIAAFATALAFCTTIAVGLWLLLPPVPAAAADPNHLDMRQYAVTFFSPPGAPHKVCMAASVGYSGGVALTCVDKED